MRKLDEDPKDREKLRRLWLADTPIRVMVRMLRVGSSRTITDAAARMNLPPRKPQTPRRPGAKNLPRRVIPTLAELTGGQ